MSSRRRIRLLWPALVLAGVTASLAQDAPSTEERKAETEQDQAEQAEEDEPRIAERIVVSASATGDELLDAPAAVDVIDSEELEHQAGDTLVDHLRRIPGIHVVQFSSRDTNIASRSATGGINNSTLVLSDGRSLYQDFLGFTMWEFAPTDFSLVDRVEVVRGPVSSLWGANAVGGLVHIFTKSPRETLGGQLRTQAGSYDSRRIELRQSFLAGPWALRVSGSFFESDAFERPRRIRNFYGETVDPDLGLIEDAPDSRTTQPRLDLRADWDGPAGGRWILQGGWGRTEGWIATGLGPFDVDPSTSSSYVQARYQRGPWEAQVYTNWFDGQATNLINALPFSFSSGATNASFRGRSVLGRRGVVGWGVELERSAYDLSIAPAGERRSRASAFAELELPLGSRFWLLAGGRADYFRETVGTVFSPRASLRYKPRDNHTLRMAWGRAFRSPTLIETDLDVPSIPVAILQWEKIDIDADTFSLSPIGFFTPLARIICLDDPDNCGVTPGAEPDYIATTAAAGSRDLEEEVTQSFELGYAAQLGAFEVSANVYRSRSRGGIDFPQVASYGVGPDGEPGTADDIILPADPDGDGIAEAPEIDACPYLDALPPFNTLCPQGPVPYNHALSILLDGQIPARFQYANGATTENRGVELGLRWRNELGWSVRGTYAWQDDPRANGVRMSDRIEQAIRDREAGLQPDTSDFVNVPAEHRVSLGFDVDRTRWFASASWDWVDRTFWQDVLTSDFWGYVPSYSLVGLRGGWRWPSRGLELGAQVTNLLDDRIQQHIYGDYIGRRATLSLTWNWERGRGVGSRTE